ncbi:MAG: hypothetical protein WAL02_13725, partial [Rhodoplanes sp.]
MPTFTASAPTLIPPRRSLQAPSHGGLSAARHVGDELLLDRIEHRDDFTAAVLGNRSGRLFGGTRTHDFDPQ